MSGMDRWIDVCASRTSRGSARRVPRARAATSRCSAQAADRVFALVDRCPHKGGPLSQGIVFGDRGRLPAAQLDDRARRGSAVAPDEGCTRRSRCGSATAACSTRRSSTRRSASTPAGRDPSVGTAASPAPPARMRERRAPVRVRSTCPYCGVGCGVLVESAGTHHRRARRSGASGQPRPALQQGLDAAPDAGRRRPRRSAACSRLRPSRGAARAHRWDTALDYAADRVFAGRDREHGPDSVAFYISGQLLTEDYYVFNKLAKGLIGTNNIDTNSRLCMSSAVAGYKQTLGADAPPACYEDLDHAECLFIAGSNPALAHPVLFRRIEDAKRRAIRSCASSSSIRGAPRPRRRRPAPRDPARHRRRAVPRDAARDAVGGVDRRRSSRRTPTASRR